MSSKQKNNQVRAWYRLQARRVSGERIEVSNIEKLYAARLLCAHSKKLLSERRIDTELLSSILGYSEEDLDSWEDRGRIIKELEALRTSLPEGDIEIPETLLDNIELIADCIGLDGEEKSLLAFLIYINSSGTLLEVSRTIGDLDWDKCMRSVVAATGIRQGDVKRYLSKDGSLVSSGLISKNSGFRDDIQSRFDMIDGLEQQVFLDDMDANTVFRGQFIKSNEAELTLEDYPHFKDKTETILDHVSNALKHQTKGVNILLHGVPGTGKTALVSALCSKLGADLYQVAHEDSDGDALSGHHRYRSYQLSQSVLGGQKDTVLLFDEIEDVFQESNDFFGSRVSKLYKSTTNYMLENNPTPAFWVTNDASYLDPAFIRRFDVAIEVGVPPQSVRKGIISKLSNELDVSDDFVKHLASSDQISPAVITSAFKVASSFSLPDQKDRESRVHQLLEGKLSITGQRLKKPVIQKYLSFRIDAINADTNIRALAESIEPDSQARICLYGPPGTGKTSFGQFLSEKLDQPLIVKKASDLMSMWVGGTEKNIANMFREAEAENAVVLLDEADSFLADRRGARASWEVTQVNELLTQMESFEGVFIATTNLFGNLDQASLRRFDLKVKYDFLSPEQRQLLLSDLFDSLGVNFSEHDLNKVDGIDSLTPGDYSATYRAASIFKGKPTVRSIVSHLEGLSKEKEEVTGSHRIGFV